MNPQELLADLSDLPELLSDMDFSYPDTHLGRGTTYYVSPIGRDANRPSAEYPFRTIQKALDASTGGSPDAYDVIVVRPGTYVVDPLRIRKNNIEIVFQEGVELVARPIDPYRINSSNFGLSGTFENINASMIDFYNTENVVVRGHGTVLRMEKIVYMGLPSEHRREFRAGVKIIAGRNICISGLVICDTGGDGIWIGGTTNNDELSYSQNIRVQNVVVDSAYRNGASVISVDGLVIDQCVFRNSRGTLPEAGLQFEPNSICQRLANIAVRNVTFTNNYRRGIHIQADMFQSESGSSPAPAIDMLFENITIENDNGIEILRFFDNRPKINVTFRDLTMKNTTWGVRLYTSAKQAEIRFENCIWSDVVSESPVYIYALAMPESGGITFQNCQIFDSKNQPSILFAGNSTHILKNVSGRIYVRNTNYDGTLFDTRRADLVNVTLQTVKGIAAFVPRDF